MGNHFNHFNQINMDFLNQAKIEDNGDKKLSLVITIDSQNVGEVREQEPVRRFQNPLSNLNASASVATDPSFLSREQRPRGGGDRLGPKIPESPTFQKEPVRRSQSLSDLPGSSVEILQGSQSLSNLNASASVATDPHASASVATDPSFLLRENIEEKKRNLGPKIPEKYVPYKPTLCDHCIGIGILSIIVTLVIGILALLVTGLYYLAKCEMFPERENRLDGVWELEPHEHDNSEPIEEHGYLHIWQNV